MIALTGDFEAEVNRFAVRVETLNAIASDYADRDASVGDIQRLVMLLAEDWNNFEHWLRERDERLCPEEYDTPAIPKVGAR